MPADDRTPDIEGTLERLRAWIGRQVVYQAPEEVGPAGIRLFALALADDPPDALGRGADAAVDLGVDAVPTFLCETNQFYGLPADENGYNGHRWEFPLADLAFMRGGNDYEFFRPLRASDIVTVTWTVVDVFERPTERGGMLIFVVSEAQYTSQHGELLAVNRETNIYRPI